MQKSSSSYVLYVDHQGHPAPLSQCYHATGSRRLSSSVDRHPPSTITEFDSAYCPQCLSFHDVATAASLGFCPRPTCKRCPVCTAVAVVAVLDDQSNACGYRCGYCPWTSTECGITVTVLAGEDGIIAIPHLVRATEQLGTLLTDHVKLQETAAEAQFHAMLGAWDAIAKAEVRRVTLGTLGTKSDKRDFSEIREWGIQALEESIRLKRESFEADTHSIVGGQELTKVSLDEEEPTASLDESLVDLPSTTFLYQSLTSGAAPKTRSDLLPLPIPLRPRKSRRCRAELAEGRPGILVKPKLNPLEGDSSLRTGNGQWWKKDSSAIHVLPRVRVVKMDTTSSGARAFLLKVTNPTLGPVKLRFVPSTYQREISIDGGGKLLKHVLMDSLEESYADLVLDRNAAIGATEVIELDSMEDALLEIGTSLTGEKPDPLKFWSPPAKASASGLRLIEQHKDSAWVEVIVIPDEQVELQSGQGYAIPLALQIQVGEGSWESSLIKPLSANGPDQVAFDLLVVTIS